MINFESAFPILVGSTMVFLILKAIVVHLLDWRSAMWRGWTSASVGVILVFAIYYVGVKLLAGMVASFALFFVLYIAASFFFARKYGATLGLYITNILDESRPMAYPLWISEVFLIVLILMITILARSAPWIGLLILAYLLMIVGTIVGRYWYKETSFKLWLKKLEVKDSGVVSQPSKEQSNRKDQRNRFATTMVWALDQLEVVMAYLGLPVLLSLILPEPSFLSWIGCFFCLVGFSAPPIYFRTKRSSTLRSIIQEYAKLKQADASGDLRTIVTALDNRHIRDISQDVLLKQFRSNESVVFEHLLQILVAGKGNWGLVYFLWVRAANGRYPSGPLKLNPTFAVRLLEMLSEKSIPIDQRSVLLYYMVKDEDFVTTKMLQERLPEIMTDSELMKELEDKHRIVLKPHSSNS